MTELYRGRLYEVSINGNGDGYQVTNLVTGVVEYENKSLPRCLIIFDESEDYMGNRKDREEAEEVVQDARVLTFRPKNNPE